MKPNTYLLALLIMACSLANGQTALTYPIVDTDVQELYSNTGILNSLNPGDAFYGQDGSYSGFQPSYTNNGDGTISDNITGLMWARDMGSKMTYFEALQKADTSTLGGYSDWRLPTIKELYSLALFTGRCFGDFAIDKFIDTNYFIQPIGDVSQGEREIDGQVLSNTQYVDLVFGGDTALFGYNFVDGRLKAYPKYDPMTGTANNWYFRMVRGSSQYGINNYTDNADGTISDQATGLMWQQADDGNTYDWEDALAYAENLNLAGYSDWRLPNAKELHSIVDYSRSPSTSNSPAIDPLFSCTGILDPNGASGQYGYYWTGSPLKDGPEQYSDAVYISFGIAQGRMETPPNSGNYQLLDVHGAGAQRNDPKTGNPSDFPDYFGPQGDVRYIFNFVRCVRDINPGINLNEFGTWDFKVYPNPATDFIILEIEQHPNQINSSKIEVEIYNPVGQLVQELSFEGEEEIRISCERFSAGLYSLKINADQQQFTKKVLIK